MITGTVRGDERVVAMLGRVAPSVRARMMKTMEAVGSDLAGHVMQNKLSGQVLKRRTGDLSRSINSAVRDSAESVSAVVGSALPGAKYPRAHEYGFQGTVTVPAHQRMQIMAWGKSIAARMVNVRAHPMQMNLPERSFLRSSLAEKGPEEVAKIRASMAELLAQVQA